MPHGPTDYKCSVVHTPPRRGQPLRWKRLRALNAKGLANFQAFYNLGLFTRAERSGCRALNTIHGRLSAAQARSVRLPRGPARAGRARQVRASPR